MGHSVKFVAMSNTVCVAASVAFGTKVRGFAPGRNRRIFRAKKSSTRLPLEGK